jgi:DNA-directed RNA polymerase subunit alpha
MDYDKLTLEVWTDGTIKPVEAVSKAAEIFIANLRFFQKIESAEGEEDTQEFEESDSPTPQGSSATTSAEDDTQKNSQYHH